MKRHARLRLRHFSIYGQRIVSITVLLGLFLLTLPAPVSAAAVRDLGAGLVALQAQTWWWLGGGEQEKGQGRLEGRGEKSVAESQEQKQARVARLQVSPA